MHVKIIVAQDACKNYCCARCM